MSDALLRDLERRWRRSGSPEDGARYLQACLRAGVLGPERVRLAGFLGDPIAAELTGAPPPPDGDDEDAHARWIELATAGDPEGAHRAGLVIARLALPEWERYSARLTPRWRVSGERGRPRLDPRPAELIQTLERWLLQPGDPARRAALERARDAASEVVALRSPSSRARAARDTVRALLHAAHGQPGLTLRACYDRLYPEPGSRIRAALQRDVLPWALGLTDPLATAGWGGPR